VMMSGFFFANDIFSLVLKVALPAAIGTTLGSYVVYFVARYGGKLVLEKWGKYFGLFWEDIEKLTAKLTNTKKDEIIIAVARMTPVIPSVAVSAFCGIVGMNIYRYFFITIAGVFVRSVILGAIGWQAGNIYQKYATTISSIENAVLLSTISALVIFFVLKYKGENLR